jgi:hypothetical protein
MIYFKAAGARGQALHQDQYYLRVNPGTCCAAWWRWMIVTKKRLFAGCAWESKFAGALYNPCRRQSEFY